MPSGYWTCRQRGGNGIVKHGGSTRFQAPLAAGDVMYLHSTDSFDSECRLEGSKSGWAGGLVLGGDGRRDRCGQGRDRWHVHLGGLRKPDDNYGLHGARVGGYNKSLRANGDELTVAHGLWRSRGHTRYARWKDTEVAGLTAAMAGEQSVYQDAQVPADGRPLVPTPQPRRSGRGRGRGRAGRGGRGDATTTATTAGNKELPAGWTTDIDGLFVPPAAMAAAGVEPQATLERARKIDKQIGALRVAMAGAAEVRAQRTRQGVN
jgi:hypothetical protein